MAATSTCPQARLRNRCQFKPHLSTDTAFRVQKSASVIVSVRESLIRILKYVLQSWLVSFKNRIDFYALICSLVGKLTGKYFSEALILASTNPQYDKRLFIELQIQYMKIASSEHGENMLFTQIVFVLTFRTTYVHNMLSPCSPHVVSLQFSCTELVIKWTIFCLIMG